MAKENKVKKEVKVVTSPSQLPAELLDKLEQHGNQGLSKSQEDNLVPLVYILQKQSPQVEEHDTRYIPGAKAADIWLRNAPNPIVKGSEGILFQPCFFDVNWIEWIPRDHGGGFVARHTNPPEDANPFVDPQNPGRRKFLRPNGNEVIQTRNHIGFVLVNGKQPMPYVIPMTSSGHTISKNWMSDMNMRLLPSGKSAPSWAFIYRMKTRLRQNQYGSWFTWEINGERPVQDAAEFERGLRLFEAFNSGEKQAETPQQEELVVEQAQDTM